MGNACTTENGDEMNVANEFQIPLTREEIKPPMAFKNHLRPEGFHHGSPHNRSTSLFFVQRMNEYDVAAGRRSAAASAGR